MRRTLIAMSLALTALVTGLQPASAHSARAATTTATQVARGSYLPVIIAKLHPAEP